MPCDRCSKDSTFFSARKKFKEEYQKLYKNNPHSLAALAYDLVGLISSLNMEHKKITKEILHSNLGYIGINGWFRFDESGKYKVLIVCTFKSLLIRKV